MHAIKGRHDANVHLVKKLLDLVNTNPDLRFGQILINFDFIKGDNDFYTESSETLERVEKAIKDLK